MQIYKIYYCSVFIFIIIKNEDKYFNCYAPTPAAGHEEALKNPFEILILFPQ